MISRVPLCVFLFPAGKSVGEIDTLWETLNQTKQDIKEMRAKTNKQHQVGFEDPASGDDNNGNTQVYLNATTERLKRLENESASLRDEVKGILNTTQNLLELQLKVIEFHGIYSYSYITNRY